MFRPVLLLAVVMVQAGGPALGGEHPRPIMRLARYVIEGDSSPAVAARWSDRLARDSTDRAAILGLATIARLTADDSAAYPLYQRLLHLSPARADEYGLYARLGLARLNYEAVQMEKVDSPPRWRHQPAPPYRERWWLRSAQPSSPGCSPTTALP